jgi:hypothetical protein
MSCLKGVTSATADPEMYRLDILYYPGSIENLFMVNPENLSLVMISFPVRGRIYRER